MILVVLLFVYVMLLFVCVMLLFVCVMLLFVYVIIITIVLANPLLSGPIASRSPPSFVEPTIT